MSNSGLTKYQDECLLILQEECGETVQEICKITRFGLNKVSHHTVGKSHLECLTQELGDLLAMIQMVAESGIGVTEAGLKQAMANKLAKVQLWMYNKPIVALAPQNRVVKARKKAVKQVKKAKKNGKMDINKNV